MTGHWIIVPVLLPAFTAVTLLLGARWGLPFHRRLSVASTLALVGVAGGLVAGAATGSYGVYELGSWPAPFGIVLVVDRLSAFLVLVTAGVGLFSLLHAIRGWDERGRNYHALFQFQLMGLCGAFLTGDLFNLFVFFEILLIASYGLLLHGGGPERLSAGLRYVVLNLTNSALFIVAVALLYGVTGTLNMADLAVEVQAAGPADAGLIRAGGLLLLVVFSFKAALLPLYFWLPAAYSSAVAPVAALFAIMTKVGVYAIVRVFPLVFGAGAGVGADVAGPWLLPVALLTLTVAFLGVLAARGLREMTSYFVVASVGTMLTAVGLFNAESLSAAIFYMGHSTFVLAGLFLLAELIAGQRQEAGDWLVRAPAVVQPGLLGFLFVVGGMTFVGTPPFSGFIGKLLVLESAVDAASTGWVFLVVLGTGLLGLIGLSRAGSDLFWRTAGEATAAEDGDEGPPGASVAAWGPTALLFALGFLLAALAGPITEYTDDAAGQLLEPAGYVEAVLGPEAGSPPEHGAAERPPVPAGAP